MARKIQFKRGLEANLPQLDVAEFGFTTDSKKPFIGSSTGNVELSKKVDVDALKADTTLRGINVEYPPAPLVAAVGNGTTDDYAVIQNIINYASSNNYAVIFPQGTYIISARLTLPSNCTIFGNFAKIKLKNNTSTGNNPDLFLIQNVSNVRIFNLELDGNNSNQTQLDSNVYRGILIQNSSDILIENCYFHDIQHQAIQVVGSTPGNSATKGVYNLIVTKCKFYNIWSSLQITESDSRYVYFLNNDVENTWEHGFTTYPGNSYIHVVNNEFRNLGLRDTPTYSTYNAGCGIRIFETINAIVSGNTIINPNFCGIRVTTNNPVFYQQINYVLVENNIIRGGTRNGNKGNGINVGEQGFSNNVILKGNIIENFVNYSFGDGILLLGNNCIVEGNRIQTTKQSGINVQGNQNTVSNNNISDSGLYGLLFGGTNAVANNVAANNTIQTISQTAPISRGVYAQANCSNLKISNNHYVGVLTNVFNGSAEPIFINGNYEGTASPTAGTFLKGDRVKNSNPSVGSPKGWICTGNGTQGTLNSGGTTGSITTGTAILTVNSTTGLSVGNVILIAGVTGVKKVISISGTTVTLDANADATVSSAAVSFVNAVFASEGNL